MDIKSILKSFIKILCNSQKSIHILVLVVSLILIVTYKMFNIVYISKTEQLAIITGISLLASFFILTLQNIDYKYINEKFSNTIKKNKSTEIKESVQIRATIFSLAIICFVLIGISFVLYIFNISIIYLILLLVNYLFSGIIYSLVIWNYIASKK